MTGAFMRRGSTWGKASAQRFRRHGRIVGGVALLWGAGKVLALGKDLAIAFFFGASAETDAYFIATNIPTLIYGGLLGSVPIVLLPLYTERLERASFDANLFVSRAINSYVAMAAFLAIPVAIFAPDLVGLLAPGVPEGVAALAADLTRIFAATFVFSMASGGLTTIQLAHSQTLGVQVVPIVNHSIFIIGVVLFAREFGIFAAAVAAAVGWVAQVPLQRWLLRGRYEHTFSWSMEARERASLISSVLPATVAVSIEQLNPVIAVYFGSSLAVGSVSIVNYGLRVVSLATSLFVVIAATLVFPRLARTAADLNGEADFRRVLGESAEWLLMGAVLVTVLVASSSEEVAQVVYGRGRVTPEEVSHIAAILTILSFSVPFVALRELSVRALYAQRRGVLGMLGGMLGIGVTVGYSAIFVSKTGLSAIAWGITTGSVAGAVVSALLIAIRTGGIPVKSTLKFVGRVSAATALAIAAMQVASGEALALNPFGRLITVSMVGGLVYTAAAFSFGTAGSMIRHLLPTRSA